MNAAFRRRVEVSRHITENGTPDHVSRPEGRALFIIRALFWLTVVLLLIPGGGKDGASFSDGAADALHPGVLKAEDIAPQPLQAARAAGKA